MTQDVPSFVAAEMIGEQVMEMADRVLTMHKISPGSVAKSDMELDGITFEILLRVKPEDPRNDGITQGAST